MMKAIRVSEFGGPEKLVLQDLPDLRAGAGQVVIKMHAAGVNPFEAYMRTGTYGIKPNLPYTPGADGAGTVLAVGEGVTRVTKGDRVYCAGSVSGTYAEQALCSESQVHRLPKNTSFAQGAAMGVPYGTAYRALFQKAHLMPGETVLIHGASGGVGSAAVQLARARGATVIGTGGTDAGRALVKKEGAHHVLDHHAADFSDQLMKLTGGNGVNAIIEMLANKNLANDLTLLSKGGRVVVVGSRGPIEINPRDAMGRDASIHGMTLFNASECDLAQIHAALVSGLENGTLRPAIAQEIPLKDAATAHEEVMKPTGAAGKIVLRIAAE
jgi:NADPH:quinone reductase